MTYNIPTKLKERYYGYRKNNKILKRIEATHQQSNRFYRFFLGYVIAEEIIDRQQRARDSEKESTMKYKKTEIKRRNDGRWYARYTLQPGKYKYIYGKTQLDCYQKLKEFANNTKLIKKIIKELEAPKPKKITFGNFFKTWLEQEKIPKCKASSIRTINSKYNNYLYVLANRPIDEITANEVRTLLNGITSASTRDRCHTILSDLFKHAVNYDLVQTSIMQKITRFRYKGEPLEPLTHEEEKLFIQQAEKYDCALVFYLMLYEGLRTSEAKAITPADIKDKYIIVDKQINDSGEFIPTKTGNRRVVPIFDKFKPYADKYRGFSTTPCLGKVNKHTAVKEYREIQQATKIKKRMYTLRHTFATRCEEAGISIKQTATWMGHSTIQTTLNSYIGIINAFETDNINKKNKIDD